MLDGEEHWNALPAEILVSRRTGALRAKPVGT